MNNKCLDESNREKELNILKFEPIERINGIYQLHETKTTKKTTTNNAKQVVVYSNFRRQRFVVFFSDTL